ncbi:MAG: 2,3-bisphosphoglycerate-independent phosphoglycerate mutase [Thermoleophilia bacterium]|nr:2,3-bisphosphoglycerate-independent phosphoglycerate mutase [Thermoleophilia bacterium]
MAGADPSFVCLLVLDGWGIAEPGPGNAIAQADTPKLDRLYRIYPHTVLKAAGEAVGLPPGQMGNSEVGHLNLGAGRVVYQDLTRINLAIADGSFFLNQELVTAFARAGERDSAVHLMGLLSDGGVHSDIGHLKALVRMAKRLDCQRLFLHLFLDGRDVSPTSGFGYMETITDYLGDIGVGDVATVAGRYYAMDRDQRWERTRLAYDAIVHGHGPRNSDPLRVIENSYKEGVTDEFVIPTVVSGRPDSRIHDSDSVIFFNFRPDRARQLTRSLIIEDFDAFDRGPNPPLPWLVTMTEYDARFDAPVAYPPEELKNVLAAVLSKAGKTQLHIAETEKYAHVTFFFNGGVEAIYPGETRKLIPSPKEVPTYDQKPEMSAREVTAELVSMLDRQHFDFIIVNLANCDMVGHTGVVEAAVKAVEVVDECVGGITGKVQELGGVCIITSDHGNAERMVDPGGGPDTAHTTELVPLIITAPVKLAEGCALGDVAPTILKFLKLSVPRDMTGRCMVSR